MATRLPVTAEIAARLLEADLANIIRKVNEGRPLNRGERARLAEAESTSETDGGGFVDSVTELARILGVARQTVNRWRREPGAPRVTREGRHDVAAWRRFQAETGKKGAGEDCAEEMPVEGLPAEGILKRRKLLLFCEEKAMLLAYRRGELIEAELVRETWEVKRTEARVVLATLLTEDLAKRIAGKEGPDIQEALAAVVDEFVKAIREGGD